MLVGQTECCWASVAVRRDVQEALSIDYALLTHDFLTATAAPQSQPASRQSRAAAVGRPCRMRFVARRKLCHKAYYIAFWIPLPVVACRMPTLS